MSHTAAGVGETFAEALAARLHAAAVYNRAIESPPCAVLWPDLSAEWSPVIPELRRHASVLTLGPYAPADGRGPAAWIRCMVARSLADAPPPGVLPIVYLPGVGPAALSDTAAPSARLPLLDLAHRGVVWTRPTGREWSVAAFMEDAEHGLGVPLRQDAATREALGQALHAVATLPVARLRADAPWRASDFLALVHPPAGASRVEELIARGEGPVVEFKSSFRWDVKNNQQADFLMAECIDTVAAFLNGKGGTLLIGVQDDGTPFGLVRDLKLAGGSRDKFELSLRNQINEQIGRGFAHLLEITFEECDGHTVCLVEVQPAPEPAYVKEKGSPQFYVRLGNQSPKLPLPDAVRYIRDRWPSMR